MTGLRSRPLVDYVRRRALACPGGMSDGDLLERFVKDRDDAAFAELVRRHGPMVLGVCKRTLAHWHDAEDAFQAAFLVLVRRADSVRPRDRVGPWLYGVAYRIALKARSAALRRQARERTSSNVPGVERDTEAER